MTEDDIENMVLPTTLSELLDFRDYTYKAMTVDATNIFSLKLTDAVNFYLNSTNPIDWQHIEKVSSLDGFVRVIGASIPSVGETIKVDKEDILITKDNFAQYKQLARFVLPITILETGTSIQIFQFIRDVTAIASLITDIELENILREYSTDGVGELSAHPTYIAMLDKITKPADVLGFDTSNLTDEQIRSLNMFDKLVPGGSH